MSVTTNQIISNSSSLDLLSGEDQANNWMSTADGAVHYQPVFPVATGAASSVWPNSNRILGSTGAAGDYLKALKVNVTANTDSYVIITDGTPTAIASGTSGTAPSGTTALAVTASSSQTWTVNQYVGNIVSITYIPTSGVATVVKRKIVAHPVFSGVTAITATLDHAVPAGASITAWALEPLTSSFEVAPFDLAKGIFEIPLGIKSSFGGWRISVGSTVQVVATGKFT